MTGPAWALRYQYTLRGISEPLPGPRWKASFDATWPSYRRWYLGGASAGRPDVQTAVAMLAHHMPELMPTFGRLCALVGDDPDAVRMLTSWNPPRFSPGCSQLALGGPWPVLCRNYDYSPDLFEGVVLSSAFTGHRVLGTADLLWGLLDGMNDAGLAVSLTFGGRPGTGVGFGIPLVVRYLLEVAATTAHACEVLRRLPVAMSYNLTIVDASGATPTAYLAPGTRPEFTVAPLATNHRGDVPEFPEHAKALHSVERRAALQSLSAARPGPAGLAAAFLAEPLHNTGFSRAFGTLYTALYQPAGGFVDYVWPDRYWRRTFDAPDEAIVVTLHEGG